MQLIQNKKLLTLSSILAFLVLLFGASFIKPIQKKSQQLKSAILNPKYEVSQISFDFPALAKIELYNCNEFWGGYYTTPITMNRQPDDFYFPVNTQIVNSFLNISKTVSDYNLILEGKSKKDLSKLEDTYKKYGLDEENATVLTFYDKEKNIVSKLYFGNLDETMTHIFFKSDKNYAIYSMSSKIADYLEFNVKFWCDQEMIPKSISKNIDSSKIQNIFYREVINEKDTNIMSQNLNAAKTAYSKMSSLRYSEFGTGNTEYLKITPDKYYDQPSFMNKVLDVKVIDDKSTEYNYYFYKTEYSLSDITDYEKRNESNSYHYTLQIKPSILYSDEAKEFIKKLNCVYVISEWTFNSLVKSLKEE